MAWKFARPAFSTAPLPSKANTASKTGWMFCAGYFRGLSPQQLRDALADLAGRLRPALYRDGVWTLDYRRLRIVAVKTAR